MGGEGVVPLRVLVYVMLEMVVFVHPRDVQNAMNCVEPYIVGNNVLNKMDHMIM